jgi:hypothetical protein
MKLKFEHVVNLRVPGSSVEDMIQIWGEFVKLSEVEEAIEPLLKACYNVIRWSGWAQGNPFEAAIKELSECVVKLTGKEPEVFT